MLTSVVAPVKYQRLNRSSFYVCYTYLLTNKPYRDFFTSLKGTILLDYSPLLPRRFDTYDTYSAIELVKPSLVVLPSVDYSYSRTSSLVESFLGGRRFRQELVGVIQGVDLDTLSRSYLYLKGKCSMIGLPSPLETIARRDEIVRDLSIREKVVYIEVHSNPYEEVPTPGAFGIYTSYPVRLASVLRRLSEFKPTPPPLDYFKDGLVEELVRKNIEEYVEAINGSCQGSFGGVSR